MNTPSLFFLTDCFYVSDNKTGQQSDGYAENTGYPHTQNRIFLSIAVFPPCRANRMRKTETAVQQPCKIDQNPGMEQKGQHVGHDNQHNSRRQQPVKCQLFHITITPYVSFSFPGALFYHGPRPPRKGLSTKALCHSLFVSPFLPCIEGKRIIGLLCGHSVLCFGQWKEALLWMQKHLDSFWQKHAVPVG